jgi:hypothetical protein
VNQEQDRNLQNETALRSELKAEFQKIVDETTEFYRWVINVEYLIKQIKKQSIV